MAETTLGYLNDLMSKYTPSSTYFDAARTHRWGIQNRLDSWLGVKEMFETGSLKHGTGVWFYSDVDYIVSLKGSRPTQATALNKVRDALKDKYPNTTVRVSRPAVVCEFAKGSETVEVVPAFDAVGGGYWIPDPKTGDWMKSHPKDHNTYVNDANKKHSGAAKKLARLAKTWKYKRSVPVSSCYLEMRAAKYADGETEWVLPIDIYRYLKNLRDIELAAMNDPTGLGSRFNAYSSDSTKANAISKLDTAVSRASKAKNYYHAGDHTQAIEQYKLLFNQ
ncbi:SMODS domain-containing nucleotidyltransferase [Streptomyces phaeochromogenes]|uniref:SMODS domain-containing nucleotidyltransferase n=1 Tax=Streptomyces phaeochromogenes TaxID=1923 RepID=UPI000B2FF66D|nr:nucleotidyltransferase [Streptomyces phaeochromogenes]